MTTILAWSRSDFWPFWQNDICLDLLFVQHLYGEMALHHHLQLEDDHHLALNFVHFHPWTTLIKEVQVLDLCPDQHLWLETGHQLCMNLAHFRLLNKRGQVLVPDHHLDLMTEHLCDVKLPTRYKFNSMSWCIFLLHSFLHLKPYVDEVESFYKNFIW